MNVVLQNEKEELKKVLAYGGASDYTEYRYIVGKIEGIDWAVNHLHHVVKSRIYEEDQDMED